MSGPVSIRPLWFLAQEREACFNAAAATTGICRGASSGRKNTAPGNRPPTSADDAVADTTTKRGTTTTALSGSPKAGQPQVPGTSPLNNAAAGSTKLCAAVGKFKRFQPRRLALRGDDRHLDTHLQRLQHQDRRGRLVEPHHHRRGPV